MNMHIVKIRKVVECLYEYAYLKDKKGGEVSLFIIENITYNVHSDLYYFNDFIECLFIEIPKYVTGLLKDVLIGVTYRPPDKNIQEFSTVIEEMLTKIKQENKYVYIMGDFNINLLNVDTHIPSSEFLENMFLYYFFPMITKPTKVKGDSATIIDNIYCNNMDNMDICNGILYTDISDHFPVFTIIPNVKVQHVPARMTTKYFLLLAYINL
jgi:hypothetical protein